jgi:alkylation response protein AidB-like acyl-CoA dehydrogenase
VDLGEGAEDRSFREEVRSFLEDSLARDFAAMFHRGLGELAMDVLGAAAMATENSALQRLFLFSRADTIYAGSNQIQRNIIGERALGLPKAPR